MLCVSSPLERYPGEITSLEEDITMALPNNNTPNNDTSTTPTTQSTGNPQTRKPAETPTRRANQPVPALTGTGFRG